MIKRAITINIIAISVVVLLLFAMHILAGFPTQIDDSIARYESALQAIPNDYCLIIEENVTITAQDAVYTEKSHITIHYQNTNSQQIQAEKTFTSGGYTVQIRELWVNGMIYTTIDDQSFCSPVSKKDISRRYIPGAMFNCRLYRSITGTKKKDTVTVHFSAPTSGEAWTLPSDAELIDAFGTAFIDKNGQLTESAYEISYLLNELKIHKQYAVTYETNAEKDIILPDDFGDYTPVESIDGPILLERLCGILLQTKGLSSTIRESIFCGAFGDQRNTVYEFSGNRSDARVKTIVTTYNSSHPDNAVQAVTESSEDLTNRYYNLLLGGIPALEHIEDVKISEEDKHIQIICIPTEAYARHLTEYICDSLYETPDILTSRATAVTISTLGCTIKLDDTTLLPQEINTKFTGFYTLDGIAYPIEYTFNQIFETEKAGASLLLVSLFRC